jgi:hypothetical protein
MCIESCAFVLRAMWDCLARTSPCRHRAAVSPINEIEERVQEIAFVQIIKVQEATSSSPWSHVHFVDSEEIYPGITLPPGGVSTDQIFSPVPPEAIEFLNL